jgi:hypothetical protein
MFILVDIDHTVANSFWRDGMIGTVSWDEYHENAKFDKSFKNVVTMINALASIGYIIIGITNRPEKFRLLTVNWLIKNQIHIDELLMRPDDIFLVSNELKLKLIKDYFHDNYKNIHFAIDDNEETILSYYKLNIPTLQIRNINHGKNGNGISH